MTTVELNELKAQYGELAHKIREEESHRAFEELKKNNAKYEGKFFKKKMRFSDLSRDYAAIIDRSAENQYEVSCIIIPAPPRLSYILDPALQVYKKFFLTEIRARSIDIIELDIDWEECSKEEFESVMDNFLVELKEIIFEKKWSN